MLAGKKHISFEETKLILANAITTEKAHFKSRGNQLVEFHCDFRRNEVRHRESETECRPRSNKTI